jgi:glycosyltransferase involved in cell wall biosynthesis
MIASSNIMWCGQWPYFHLFALAGKTASVDRMVIDWWETWDEHWLEYLGHLGVIGRFVERSSLKVLNGDARIVTNSEMGRRDILRIGAPSDAVKVIHNGISLKDIFAEPPYSEQVDIIFCGRLKNHKNVDHLLKALDILKDNGMTYTLDIIGDGPERVFLEQLAATLGLARTVRFLGVIKSSAEVYRRMKSAKLYVNPSTKEGGGSIALFEANACGLPAVIYKHTHGIDNALIAEGKNGLIVETVTPAGLAECIQTLLSQPLQLKKMSMESVEIAKEYDWERITASYEELFFT